MHEPNDLEIRLNGELIESIKVVDNLVSKVALDRIQKGLELPSKAGPATLGVNFVDDGALVEGMLRPYYAITSVSTRVTVSKKPELLGGASRAIRPTVSGRYTSAKKDFQLPTSLIESQTRNIVPLG